MADFYAPNERVAPAPEIAAWLVCCIPGCGGHGVYGEGVNVRARRGRFFCSAHAPAHLCIPCGSARNQAVA